MGFVRISTIRKYLGNNWCKKLSTFRFWEVINTLNSIRNDQVKKKVLINSDVIRLDKSPYLTWCFTHIKNAITLNGFFYNVFKRGFTRYNFPSHFNRLLEMFVCATGMIYIWYNIKWKIHCKKSPLTHDILFKKVVQTHYSWLHNLILIFTNSSERKPFST